MTQNLVDCTADDLAKRKLDLEEIRDVFLSLKLNCILIDGVLLGAVRDKNFIIWDWDVELALLEEEVIGKTTMILNALHAKGFQILLVNPFSLTYKINVVKRGSKFSLVGLKSSLGYRYRVNFKYPARSFETLDEINFLGKKYTIPSDVDGLLRFCYGDWRTPKKERIQSQYLNRQIYIPRLVNWLLKLFIFARKLAIGAVDNLYKTVCKIFPAYREYFFSGIMLRKALQKNATFIEIGSSDGSEMERALVYTKGDISAYLVEPSVENLEVAKMRIKKSKYAKSVSFLNQAISARNGLIAFFYNPENSNLSNIREPGGNFFKRSVKSVTLKELIILNKIDYDAHLVVKMDIEGEEAKVLLSSVEILKKFKTVSILMEVHPGKYEGDEMYNAFQSLFDIGFKVSLVETAWVRAPQKIKENFGYPYKSFFHKGLYRDLPNDFTAEIASAPVMNVALFKPFFTKKIVRSLLLEKANN
ncbi:FkbM family methyltransferase [Alphaproteobacteria bacterium]|nr:FkbM family methyltransferase [Alphaproteobacteria bacterium]